MLSEPDARPDAEEPTMPAPARVCDEIGQRLAGRTIALDCRWLGLGGAGRVTELLLTQLSAASPAGTWLLWGDPNRLSGLTFHGSMVVPWHGHPTRWFGQADLLRVPRADVVVYLHQIRPLRPGRSVTFVLDTIPLRSERRLVVRRLKSLFFRAVCQLSAVVITISPWSRNSIVRDLGVPPSRIVTTSVGVDPERIARIRAIRDRFECVDAVLFIGRFAAHKNLERLCRAFQTTRFREGGGRLVLVGGTPGETSRLAGWLVADGLADIDVRGACPEAELDWLLATCRAVVQPSLEEGYGLPAVEAAALGIQVAVSRTGYALEIPPSLATFMDPLEEASIATAIDTALERANGDAPWMPPSTVGPDVIRVVVGVLSRSA